MAARPRSQQAALKPFLAPEGEGGAPAQSDSGGARLSGPGGAGLACLHAKHSTCCCDLGLSSCCPRCRTHRWRIRAKIGQGSILTRDAVSPLPDGA